MRYVFTKFTSVVQWDTSAADVGGIASFITAMLVYISQSCGSVESLVILGTCYAPLEVFVLGEMALGFCI